jgi:hypothetical protein
MLVCQNVKTFSRSYPNNNILKKFMVKVCYLTDIYFTFIFTFILYFTFPILFCLKADSAAFIYQLCCVV